MRGFAFSALAALVVAAVCAVDQLTKHVMFGNPAFVGFSVIPHVLSWIDHHNYGITFNVPVPRFLILLLTAAIGVGLLWLLQRSIVKRDLAQTLALALVLGGALGNFTDRLLLGYVRDWILLFNRSAINLSDASIAIGLLWYFLQSQRNSRP